MLWNYQICKIVAIHVCRVWVRKVKLHFYWKLFQSLFPPVWLWESPNITESVAIVHNSSNAESSHCHQSWTWILLLQWSLCMCNTAVWVCAKLSGNFPEENNGRDQRECQQHHHTWKLKFLLAMSPDREPSIKKSVIKFILVPTNQSLPKVETGCQFGNGGLTPANQVEICNILILTYQLWVRSSWTFVFVF